MNPLVMWLMGSGILQGLMGRGNQQEVYPVTQKSTTETSPTGYQSPSLPMLDPFLMQQLIGRLGSLKGAGMPSGSSGAGFGFGTGIMDFIENMWPEMMKNVQEERSTTGKMKRVKKE